MPVSDLMQTYSIVVEDLNVCIEYNGNPTSTSHVYTVAVAEIWPSGTNCWTRRLTNYD